MSLFTRFDPELHLIKDPDKDEGFIVSQEYDFYREINNEYSETIHVAKGTKTDGASIPRMFWNILPPWGKYASAVVLHDFVYQNCGKVVVTNFAWVNENVIKVDSPVAYTRKECDDILDIGMQVLGVNKFTRWVIYTGVRVGGWKAWNNYAKKGNV